MHWLESKYIGLLSTRLRNFKRKSSNLYNFSCVICGDSETNKFKARGYIYEKKGKSVYHCHNCGYSASFSKFLKEVDVNLHNEFIVEKIKENESPEKKELKEFVNKMKPPVFKKTGVLKGLKKISQLDYNDKAKLYIEKRRIPNPYHAELFKVGKFKSFVNTVIPDKFSLDSLRSDDARIIIPFFNKQKNVIGFQGRAIGPSDVKYITIITDENSPKVFGLDKVEMGKTYYVFEGPFDAMFIPNSIATAGGDIVSGLVEFNKYKENAVVVYDNECRSKETVKKLSKAINSGYKVCIWPQSFTFKDVNDAIIGGLTSEKIKDIIDANTYYDLSAKLALQKWNLT